MISDTETTISTAGIAEIQLYYKKMYLFEIWKGTYFAMITYRTYEQLKPFCDDVSVKPWWKLPQSVSQLFTVFCNIGNCLWKGLKVYTIMNYSLL